MILRVFVLRTESHFRQLQGFLGANWRACSDNGKPLQVQVSEHKARRSNDQNALYWARLTEIAETAWLDGRRFDRDAWHHFMGSMFLPKKDAPGGELIPVSTTTLDVAQFTEYLNRIEEYAASELGLELTA